MNRYINKIQNISVNFQLHCKATDNIVRFVIPLPIIKMERIYGQNKKAELIRLSILKKKTIRKEPTIDLLIIKLLVWVSCRFLFVSKIGLWPNKSWSPVWDGLPVRNLLDMFLLRLKLFLLLYWVPWSESVNKFNTRSNRFKQKPWNAKNSKNFMSSNKWET